VGKYRGRRVRTQASHAENEDEKWRKPNDKFQQPIMVTARTPGQKQYIIAIKNSDITFCRGPAGSGKTAVAVGLGLQAIAAPNSEFDKLVIMRPAKEACDEELGHLPGDLSEKMGPWIAPVLDNMEVFASKAQIRNLFWEKKIEVIPLAYCRGRSLNNAFIIVDESQNITDKQALMILTRLGANSKMVVCGDLVQSDLRGISGLEDAMSRLDGVEGISFVELTEVDIVRHPIIAEILRRYQA
jgi:phosphate starvation-inducible PhoH-like protein